MLSGWMLNEWKKKDLRGSGCGLIKLLSGICLKDLRNHGKNLYHDSWCSSWDMNQAPPKYKSGASRLHQPVWGLWSNQHTISQAFLWSLVNLSSKHNNKYKIHIILLFEIPNIRALQCPPIWYYTVGTINGTEFRSTKVWWLPIVRRSHQI
jgi:hypothetical protein